MDTQVCRKCGIEKPLAGFYKDPHRKIGYRSNCKVCERGRTRSRSSLEYIAKKKLIDKVGHLKKVYGLTPEKIQEILIKQDSKCKICGSTEFGIKRNVPHIDHDHATGKIRGLLCCHCNIGLGCFKDNVESLKSAIKYLEAQDS
jgi:5-methylcytosine-specific restriction endonuclease McrA